LEGSFSFINCCIQAVGPIPYTSPDVESIVRVDNSSLLNDLLSDAAYRTMSRVKSYIDSEVLASESYYVIYIIVIAIRCGTFYYTW
jgi:hypothetical protein